MNGEYIKTDVYVYDPKSNLHKCRVGDMLFDRVMEKAVKITDIKHGESYPIKLEKGASCTFEGEALRGNQRRFFILGAKLVPHLNGEPLDAESDVEHPKHYNAHPSGVECIAIVQHFNFNVGNIIKYSWRAGLKKDGSAKQDLQKAMEYCKFEIERIEAMENTVIEHFKDD